jgi:hypothetical protein
MIVTTGADVALAAVILGTVGGTLVTLARTFASRANARDQLRLGGGPETEVRLQRLEQAVDAIAVEVERLSEAQRLTARLIAERVPPADRALPPSHNA